MKCYWCDAKLNEENIEKLSNARGYGYYIKCKKCGNENVMQEVDLMES